MHIIGTIVILFYSITGILGGVIMLMKLKGQITRVKGLALGFFTLVHLAFFILGMLLLFYKIPFLIILIGVLLSLVSRVVNGRFLFGRNTIHHYLVTCSIMAVILLTQAF